MEGSASISSEVLASYAEDAARDVAGVRSLGQGRRAVRVSSDDGGLVVDLHVAVDWGASIPDVGRAVQRRVRDYLARMANVEAPSVNVVVDEIGPPE
ncbi:MAG TPA: Asp23/Gls24 family envelope stress response protein [Gaiellaceae bacterium]|nr:Asp23/Gls24 family envelope stress response protein [Gaiellaceae bacterium]